MRKLLALPILALSATSLLAIGEARFLGKVVDGSGQPVAGATITIDAMEGKTYHDKSTTDKNGNFTIAVLDGTIHYRFTFSKEGVGTVVEEKRLKLLPEQNTETVTLVPPQQTQRVETKSDPVATAFNEGANLANQGDLNGAIAKFEESVKLKADFVPGWTALAKMYARAQQWQKSVDAGEKALAGGSDDEDLNGVMATSYEKVGNKAKAAEFKAKAPKNGKAIYNDAVEFINKGNDDKALPLLKEAVAADDTIAAAHYHLGRILFTNGDTAAAKPHFKRYLELAPKGDDADAAKEFLKMIN